MKFSLPHCVLFDISSNKGKFKVNKWERNREQNLQEPICAFNFCSASALTLRTSSNVDTNLGKTQDWTSGNCLASSSASSIMS